MDPQGQTTSLQRLQNVEKVNFHSIKKKQCCWLFVLIDFVLGDVQRIVKVLELAGGVMDELASPLGPRKDVVQNHCLEFMQLIKDIQVALRDEIKSACEYRPFEKCDYGSRIANEICYQKVEFVMSQLDAMKQTIDEYHAAV
ncbi:mediator of RNA polymerase II transcription subunit 11-like isoform X1 [Lotus japonicus]|uniref:mediator of RNA polymerase II transcription subunit 11-like isoform X1 n=1 Tax=Lotus japonicus TaxID=34305 RepID=UPI00258BCBC4|nr:mediator of RNA polymerase II transcription subunit 11-like isoform X1 [Lotus japonicus]XP_057419652.1 mediator of RNA polymerase II transcription subunit 11-like isoform X1 [Lotus japonicus]